MEFNEVQHFTLNGTILLSAFALDLIFGDPCGSRILSVVLDGRSRGRKRSSGVLRKPRSPKRPAGVLLVVLVVSLVSFLSHFLILSLSRISLSFGFTLSVFFAYTTLAARDLGSTATAVSMDPECRGDCAGKERTLDDRRKGHGGP